MGRPGAGSGGSRPGGSSGRSVSGRRPGSSSSSSSGSSSGRSYSRPSSSRPSSFGSAPRGGRRPPAGGYGPPPPPPPGGGYGSYNNYGGRRSRGGCLSSVLAGIIVVVIVGIVLATTVFNSCVSCVTCGNCVPGKTSDRNSGDRNSSYSTTPQNPPNNNNNTTPPNNSNITASKNTPSAEFTENCIIDELNWFDDVKKCGKDLKFFYDKLGVQPYVVFRKYDSSLLSDGDKQDFCEKWYDEHIKNEDTLLLMYFAEENSEEEIGYMCACAGRNAAAITDTLDELVLDGIDKYWELASTDDMITSAFKYAGNKITIR